MVGKKPALATALALLAARRLSVAQLRQKLRLRGFADAAVDEALEECERKRYVDDRAFAQLFVEQVLEHKPLGRLRLLNELVKRGVNGDVARAAIDERAGDEEQRVELALTRLETQRPADGYPQLARRLERLGFTAPVIARALRRRADARGRTLEDFESVE